MIRSVGFQPVSNPLPTKKFSSTRIDIGSKLNPLTKDIITLKHVLISRPMFGSSNSSLYVTANKTIAADRQEWHRLREKAKKARKEYEELEAYIKKDGLRGALGGGLIGTALGIAAFTAFPLPFLAIMGTAAGASLGIDKKEKDHEAVQKLSTRKLDEAEKADAAEDKLWKSFYSRGEQFIEGYKAIEARAFADPDNPSIDSLTQADYEQLAQGFQSNYEEVQDFHRPLMTKLRRIPGFREHYIASSTPSRVLSSALSTFFLEGIDEIAAETGTANLKVKRLKALKALIPLERENGAVGRKTRSVYPAAFHDTDSDIRVAGLEGMAELGKATQPPEYETFLKLALMGPDLGLRRASVKGLKANALEARGEGGKALSGSSMISVDKALEQLARSDAPDTQLRAAAAEAIALRKNVDAFDSLEPNASAAAICEKLVGNDALKEKLVQYINLYKTNAASRKDRGPDLLLTLDGPPGIGKTMFATSMAEELFGPNSLIEINLGEIHSPEQLTAALKARATHQDKGKAVLGKKVILLDEFHAIANKEAKTLDRIVDVLKPILGKEELSELDLKDTVVIVASNRAVRVIPELQTGTNSALLSRLERFAYPVRLNRDLRSHVKELVREFGSQELYGKDSPALKGVRLDRHARTHFVNELQAAFPTTDPDPVNGRTLVGEIARPIELALSAPGTRIERKPGEPFEVTVEDGNLKLKRV